MDQGQLPGSLEEVETLIHQLYQPGAPEKVVKTQETLQKLQRSPEGWQLANSLLGNNSVQVRFFGALTFIVKLNTDANSLGDDDAQALLQSLIDFMIKSLASGEGALVVRKLCSTLVAYFLQFSALWTRCIKHLLYCLLINEAVPCQAVEDAPETAAMVANISNEKAVAVLWFATALVEEVGKTDSNSMKQHKFHQRVVPNVDDIVPLMSKYMSDSSRSVDLKVRQESLRCFQSWVSYSHRAFIDDEIVLDPLRTLTNPTIMCLADDNLYEISVELLTDVLTNYSKFLRKEDFTVLYSLFNSPWAQERYHRLVHGDYNFDSLQFGMFMLAFGDANLQNLTKSIANDPQSQQFLSAICGLLSADGYAVYEDKIFVPALEFWNQYVETAIEDSYATDGRNQPWFPVAQNYLMQVIEKCMRKTQFPPTSVLNSWDSVDKTSFKDARRDFSDLIQQVYIITGIPILQYFIDFADKAIATKNWAELELGGLLSDGTAIVFVKTPNATNISIRPACLPTVLNILFEATNSPALAKLASDSIATLCSECRVTLVPELGAFLQQYGNIAPTFSPDGSVQHGVIEGIAALIQAIPDDESKLAPLDQLLDFVDADVEHCLRLLSLESSGEGSASQDTAATALARVALKCLEAMAKGSQPPSDKPVDLEEKKGGSPFWITGNGARIQHRIISIINCLFDAFYLSGEVVEAACQIWRKGFRELEPGPFVMPPEMALEFLTKSNSQTPRLGCVMKTAAQLINSQRWGSKIHSVLNTLLQWIAQLLHNLGEPSNDPEIAQDGIEFLTRLLHKYVHVFINHQPPASLEYLFMFTLKALAGNDPLPKGAASEFWSVFVSLSNQGIEIQLFVDNALTLLGPLLAQALIYNIGGHASRSELDRLSEPVKKLVVRQVQAKSWLNAALNGDSFPSDKVTANEKSAFLQKIINLRGARATNQVVRDFWLTSRGSNFAYAS